MYFMAIGRGRVSIEHGGWNCNCCESTIMQNLRGSCTLSWIKHENIITRLCQQPNNINCAKLFSYHIIYNLKYIAVCRVCTIKSYIVGYIWFVYFLLCFSPGNQKLWRKRKVGRDTTLLWRSLLQMGIKYQFVNY
jgi:hypothetical protein